MCGIQSPRPSQPLGGALAVLNAPTCSSPSSRLRALSGHMVFHGLPATSSSSSSSSSLSTPSNMATHITYTPSLLKEEDYDDATEKHPLDGCVIGIHSTGDLRTTRRSTTPESESEDEQDEDQYEQMLLLHRLDLSAACPSLVRTARSTELRLEGPLEIGVGGVGIIGRKVSVWRDSGNGRGVRIAEGIVGFN
ncbi:hypothetical protein PFICI_07380 [Pestalotiopsis fici W106-1]|uniref:Uncharacterized protein n=1 Tax=Pestalotiopsis fici (strain W106-1 / CGMCC3.15140) TaxID=1229662 RepID=W3X3W2_PESFW|nr:uncharacterized protein PFICI_07380 [Pestalotiopsis fici W106-1]ETS79851.1 hypothetical protein PFICI_07380 [Pestalotiopsis fici W106-1]